MEDGPDLGDFIAGVVPREGEGGYSGKLKLEKGANSIFEKIAHKLSSGAVLLKYYLKTNAKIYFYWF